MQVANILIATATVLLITGTLILVRRLLDQRDRAATISEPAAEAVALFKARVSVVREKRKVLEVHLDNYFQTMHDAGWAKLLQLLTKLAQAEAQLDRILEEDRDEQALEAATLLLGRVPPEEIQQVKSRHPGFAVLAGWQKEADAIITQLVLCLEGAATETVEVGISRQRQRKSTLLALNEVRDRYLSGRAK